MASKNQVTLTFAGDSEKLEKSFDNIGAGAKKMGSSVDQESDRLERLGETGGTTETRFLGLGAGISGVSTLLSGDAGPEDYAMAMADLGDAVEHTVAPLIAQGKELVLNGAKAVASAGQHVVSAAKVVASWVVMGAQATINAVKMAAAWVISLGPIALVIGAIGLIIAILVKLGLNFDTIKKIIGKAWEFITNAAKAAFNWLKSNWPLVLAIITGPIGLAVLAIVKNWDRIKNAFSAVMQFIRNTVSSTKTWIVNTFNSVVSFFTGIPGRVKGAFSNLGSSIVGGFKALWNNTIGGFGFSFKGFDPPGPGRIPGFSFHIPKLHGGGVFPGAPGTEGLALLMAGERVLPAGAPAPGPTVNVYVSGSILSERELVKVIRNAIERGGLR